jgi:hypothetical protein
LRAPESAVEISPCQRTTLIASTITALKLTEKNVSLVLFTIADVNTSSDGIETSFDVMDVTCDHLDGDVATLELAKKRLLRHTVSDLLPQANLGDRLATKRELAWVWRLLKQKGRHDNL